MDEILVPIALFGSIPLTVWIVSRARVRAHEASAKVMKSMIEKGEPLTPEIIKTLGTRQVKPHAPRGWVFSIAYRAFLDHARKTKRRAELSEVASERSLAHDPPSGVAMDASLT